MKIILTLIFWWAILIISVISQRNIKIAIPDYSIIYHFYYYTDPLDLSKYSKPEACLLYRVNNQSRFMALGSYMSDSLSYSLFGTSNYPKSHQGKQDRINTYSKARVGSQYSFKFSQTITKDFLNNKLYKNFGSIDGTWQCISDLKLDWLLSKDIDSISGVQVKKATTFLGGREWIVWYAPEIPINDGPYKFHGLPGLILKAYDIDKLYYFEYSGFLEKKERIYNFDTTVKVGIKSCGDLIKFMHKHKKNPQAPIVLSDQASIAQIAKKMNESRFDYLIDR